MEDSMKHIHSFSMGLTADGRAVTGYTLYGKNGFRVTISDLGGVIWSMMVPDKTGRLTDVVAGYDSVADLEASSGYLGALIGRFGNRIAGGRFTLDGVEYSLYKNDGDNHLHGGKVGYDSRIWTVACEDGEEPALHLSYLSPDGEEGYPGNLNIKVTYRLREDMALEIRYVATTDKKTVLNLTNHSYFNLGGFASGTVLDHTLQLDVSDYLETDAALIPENIVSVKGTPFDFTTAKTLRQDFWVDDRCQALKIAGGYDHCLCFNGWQSGDKTVRYRGYLEHTESGRRMELYTNQPAVQVYSANFLEDDGNRLKGGLIKSKQIALCLETQCMPDSMNHENFTPCTLDVGEVYDYTTIFKFVNQ
jgi:aldose 1-epimerase